MNIERSVKERYSRSALQREESLCCPIDYDAGLLEMLPEEIISRDYGCGDPSRYVRPGDTVLDLGSGGGKICYMAAQLTGPEGRVIGVDMNDDMLALARKYQDEMSARLGSDRVSFVKGNIQDLALDLETLEHYLAGHPVNNPQSYADLKSWEQQQRREQPLIADASVDLVISNCVLNLVSDHEKQQLVQEIYRVLKPGGRIAISDIISDRPVPAALKNDAELWSGCLSGAFQEAEFLQAFAHAGFQAVTYDKWDHQPWRVIDDIVFRSATLTAVKALPVHTASRESALMYRGPFAEILDDTGQRFPRGERVTVSATQYTVLTGKAYGDAFIDTAPAQPEAVNSCCAGPTDSTQPAQGGNAGCC
ncbi:MAG: methyltransferase domain-containing protein [Gammaproteobacteria bacterium]|nr:MAG: methyltransferase domain-containing protein [Gammaproteobacteria bacterium]